MRAPGSLPLTSIYTEWSVHVEEVSKTSKQKTFHKRKKRFAAREKEYNIYKIHKNDAV